MLSGVGYHETDGFSAEFLNVSCEDRLIFLLLYVLSCLINDAVSNPHYIASNDRMTCA